MSEAPLVSICIPTYNNARFLRECLDSINSQTYRNIEVLVGDDGSTDDTVPITNEYVEKYSFKLHRNESNLGAAATSSALVSRSSGEYVAVFHSDDVYHETIVEEAVAVLDRDRSIGIVGSLGNVTNSAGEMAGLYLSVLFILTWLGDPLNLMPRFDGWAWYLLYLGNIHIAINGWKPLAVMIMWSLAIEEQFYVAWPLLVRSVSGRQLLWWSIGLMVTAPLVRAYTLSIADYPATYVFTLCRLDALAVGALMAVLFGTPAWRDRASRLCGRLVLPASGLIVITLLTPFSPSFPQTRPWWFSISDIHGWP